MGIRSLQEALKLASTGIEIDKILIDARTVIEDAKIRWPDTIYPALQAKIAGYRNRVVDNLDDEIPL